MSFYYDNDKRRITPIDVMVVLSLINILYLDLKLLWFGSDGGTWFSIEPSTILMPLISGYCIFHFFLNNNTIKSKLKLSIVVYLCYAISITVINNNYSIYKFIFASISMIYWACMVYLFYMYTIYRGFNNKIYRFAVALFLLLFVIYLYRFAFYKTSGGFQDKTLLLNNVYYLLFLLPFLLLAKKETQQYVFFGLIFISIVLSQKRGALVIVAVCFLVWFFSSAKTKSFSSKFGNIFVVILLGIVLYYVLSYFTTAYDLSITDRLLTLFNGEDTTGSGRNDIWAEYFRVMKNDGLISIFGRGYVANNSSRAYYYLTWAHNDFIQIMFDYGYIGAILFAIVIINLFKEWRKMKISGYKYSLHFFISLLIVFINSAISMCFVYPQWILMVAVFWGVLLGDFETKQKQNSL